MQDGGAGPADDDRAQEQEEDAQVSPQARRRHQVHQRSAFTDTCTCTYMQQVHVMSRHVSIESRTPI